MNNILCEATNLSRNFCGTKRLQKLRENRLFSVLSRVSRVIISGLVIWAFTVSMGFAESFPNRPTLAGLNETVHQAIINGHAVIERDVVVNQSQNFFPYWRARPVLFCIAPD